MTIRITSSAAGESTNPPLIDCIESWNQAGQGALTQPGVYHRGYAPVPLQSGSTTICGGIFSGAALGTLTFDAVSGFWFCRIASIAARQNRFAVSSSIARFPLTKRYGAVGALPASLSPPLKRYTLSMPVRSAVAATVVEIGIAVSNGGLTGFAGNQALVWSSDPARSAGAWEARYKPTVAAPIQNLVVSSVIPDAVTWNLLGVRYTEGETPTLEMLIDNVPLVSVSGIGNMPDQTSAGSPWLPYMGINAGAGRTLDFTDSRFTVEEI